MTQASLDKQEKQKIESYLKGYSTNRKMLGAEKYLEIYGEKDGFLSLIDEEMLHEAPLAKAKMFGVRHFILDLPNGDHKLFLYYHYVKCESVERCAELLGISRRSAFRLKSKALALAYKKYLTTFAE